MFAEGTKGATKGDFAGALLAFRQCLQYIPLLAISSEQASKDVATLSKRLVEYITAMRLEVERKRMVAEGSKDTVRITELSCYMTLCGMENVHKFLAYRNALQCNYKVQNFITAAHFARLVLDLESTGIFSNKPEVIPQHKKYFQAF